MNPEYQDIKDDPDVHELIQKSQYWSKTNNPKLLRFIQTVPSQLIATNFFKNVIISSYRQPSSQTLVTQSNEIGIGIIQVLQFHLSYI